MLCPEGTGTEGAVLTCHTLSDPPGILLVSWILSPVSEACGSKLEEVSPTEALHKKK